MIRFFDGPSYVFDRSSKRKVAIRPDLSFTLKGRKFFVEVDRGTMSLKRFREKIKGYREYIKSGAFSERDELLISSS